MAADCIATIGCLQGQCLGTPSAESTRHLVQKCFYHSVEGQCCPMDLSLHFSTPLRGDYSYGFINLFLLVRVLFFSTYFVLVFTSMKNIFQKCRGM